MINFLSYFICMKSNRSINEKSYTHWKTGSKIFLSLSLIVENQKEHFSEELRISLFFIFILVFKPCRCVNSKLWQGYSEENCVNVDNFTNIPKFSTTLSR